MKDMTFAVQIKELEKRSANEKLEELEKLQKKLAQEKEEEKKNVRTAMMRTHTELMRKVL